MLQKNRPQFHHRKPATPTAAKSGKLTPPPLLGIHGIIPHLLLLLPLLILTYIVFISSLHNDFTNWDDETYLIDNEYIKHLSWDRVKYFFTHFYYGNYHPFTMVSYLLEYHFYKLDAAPFHLHNLLLHILNSALVYLLIFRISKRKDMALIGSLFFGIHPMRTESVAWLSERKDMLFSFFYIIALLFYTDYIKNSARRKKNYFFVLIFYLFSLFSKPGAVPLPLGLLAFDYLLKRPLKWNLLLEKIPHFILALVFGVVAVFAQQSSDSIAKFETFTLLQRIMFASYGMVAYILMFFVPWHQSCFHPYPFLIEGKRLPYLYYGAPFAALLFFVLIFIAWRRTQKSSLAQALPVSASSESISLSAEFLRTVVFGFFFFFFNVFLVLQLITVGNALMAERYTYISYFGFFFIAARGYALLTEKNEKSFVFARYGLIAIFTGSAAIFSYATYQRNKVWKNAETLWTDFIGTYPYYHDGYYTRAGYYARLKNYDKAMEDYTMCIKLKPDLAKSYAYRGNIYGLRGKTDLALADYNLAIARDSTYFDAYVNRAITYSILKDYDRAFRDYEKALSLNPENVNMLVNYSYALIEMKQYDKAMALCDKILNINPSHEQANLYKGICHFNTGHIDEAMEEFNLCLSANPSNASAHLNLSLCYKSKNDFEKALQHALKSEALGNKVDGKYLEEMKLKANR